MKVKMICEIVPVDIWGDVKSKNYAKKFELYFKSEKEANNFIDENSDRILASPDLFLYPEEIKR